MKALYAVVALALVAACSPAKAPAPYLVSGVEVAEPFSRPAAQGGNGAGYFSLTNGNSGPDVLVAVETPAAERVEIHVTSTEGGMMRMQELKDGLPLKAGETLKFEPGGRHLMFIGLKQALKDGDRLPATLVFKNAGRAPVEFAVQGRTGAAAADEHHGH